ncbi:hypothetical protein [Streptosporangium sp. NPDC004631]
MNRRPVTRLEAFLHALAAVVLPPKGRHRRPTVRASAGEDTAPIRAIRAANPYPKEFR